MFSSRLSWTLSFALVCATPALSQDSSSVPPQNSSPTSTFELTVAKGTPLQVALDHEVRVKQVGQPIHGRIVQPIYAFDRMVVPAGTEVSGRITKLESISGKQRTLSILNADFTPARKIEVEFDDLVLADGKHMALHTAVAPGSGNVIQFVVAGENEKKKTLKDAASAKLQQAKQQAKQEWEDAIQQVKAPGKMHRLAHYTVAQLPVHPQYLDAGALYYAELQEPLDFGSVPLPAQTTTALGSPPPSGSLVHALLVTSLNSATTPLGAPVEAVLSQPLLDGEKLILPQGSLLKGSVVEVRPARRWHRNGQLRIVFQSLQLPGEVEQRVSASLEAVQAAQMDHLQLDSEGGAEAKSPKSRYLSTAFSIALAAAASQEDADAGPGGAAAGKTSGRVAGGAGGFKLVGMALGTFVHSQPFGLAMGAYGASLSVYSHFLGRGRDVVFPKNTPMEIGFGEKIATSRKSPPAIKN
jgi:hypothetical protein